MLSTKDRTLMLSTKDRTLMLYTKDRTLMLSTEDRRTLMLSTEDGTLMLSSKDRTLMLSTEDRTLNDPLYSTEMRPFKFAMKHHIYWNQLQSSKTSEISHSELIEIVLKIPMPKSLED